MGLLRFLLGFDRGDLARLEERARLLEEENKALREEVESLAKIKSKIEKDNMLVREEVESLAKRLEELAAAVAAASGSQTPGAREYEYDSAVAAAGGDDGEEYGGGYASDDTADRTLEGVVEEDGYYDGGPPGDSVGDEEVVLGAIVSGVTSPSEIMEVTGLSKHRVYAALKSLVDKGIIVKRREGRRVHYLPAEGIPEAAAGGQEVEAPA